jgi:4-aminobutyrate aminotransferase-like enzyme
MEENHLLEYAMKLGEHMLKRFNEIREQRKYIRDECGK